MIRRKDLWEFSMAESLQASAKGESHIVDAKG